MILLPADWSQDYSYESYSAMESRITSFDNVTSLGKEASGVYDIYQIEMGNPDGAVIYVQSSLHGAEWEGTIFAMRFMEQLRDDTFTDTEFRNHLLANYRLIFVPFANPWGYANQIRENSNSVDLNRDFYDLTQVESQTIANDLDILKPFAFLDIHLMQILYNSHELIWGAGQYEHMLIQDHMADSWSAYMDSEPVRRWTPSSDSTSGLARTYAAGITSPYLGDNTMSFISEITRETENGVYFTRPQIMKAGMGHLYIFLHYVMEYFENRSV